MGLINWGGFPFVALLICEGIIITLLARRWVLSLTYVASFFIGVLIRASLVNLKVINVAMPMTGVGFILFTFY